MSKHVKTYSSALVSLDALLVTVELSVSKGFNISMVGLPDAAVRESLSRVYTACDSSDAHPKTHNTVINLSPGDVRKEGTVFDLPIAVALLAANEVIPEEPLANFVMAGELSLDGTLQPVKGILPMAIMARVAQRGYRLPRRQSQARADGGQHPRGVCPAAVLLFGRLQRGQGATRPSPSHGGRSCRRTQHHYDRIAWIGQVNGRQASPHDPPTAHPPRSSRDN